MGPGLTRYSCGLRIISQVSNESVGIVTLFFSQHLILTLKSVRSHTILVYSLHHPANSLKSNFLWPFLLAFGLKYDVLDLRTYKG